MRANYPGVRWNLNLNQNLNREPWSATSDILNSVRLDVNPVFRALKVRLLKPVPCTKGQVLALTFNLDGPVQTDAKVARTKPGKAPGTHEVGVHFTNLKAEDRARIERLVQKLA